jgi:hypothetical protein
VLGSGSGSCLPGCPFLRPSVPATLIKQLPHQLNGRLGPKPIRVRVRYLPRIKHVLTQWEAGPQTSQPSACSCHREAQHNACHEVGRRRLLATAILIRGICYMNTWPARNRHIACVVNTTDGGGCNVVRLCFHLFGVSRVALRRGIEWHLPWSGQ